MLGTLSAGTPLVRDSGRAAGPGDSLPAGRQPRRIVDLGCGTGDLTARIAGLWPDAEVIAVDQSPDMTLLTEITALGGGHRNVRTITADAGGPGIEPGTADLVVASFIANNMLIDAAGPCPPGDTDVTGYAAWYHAWDSRTLPLLEQARRLLAPGGCLVSAEPNNYESAINAWARSSIGESGLVRRGRMRSVIA